MTVGTPSPRGIPWTIELTAEVAAAASENWMALRCDSVAPFGVPVVPLVKMIVNGSSSSTSVGGGVPADASAAARSSVKRMVGGPSPPSAPMRSKTSSSTTSSEGATSAVAVASSAAVQAGFMVATTAPAWVAPHRARACSTVTRPANPTRSPGAMAWSSASTDATCAATVGASAKVTVRSGPTR